MEQETRKVNNIEYVLNRRAKKNINLRIEQDGTLYVSAPKRITIKELETNILKKLDWILTTKEKILLRESYISKNEIKNGNEIYFKGIKFIIEININGKNEIYLLGNKIIINSKQNDNEHIKKMFNKWMYAEAMNTFECIVDKFIYVLAEYNLKKPEIHIRKMKSRWGSCIPSKNEIILNLNLVHAPLSCIEYVVLHELSHFIRSDHSKEFYDILSSKMPDWEVRKKMLV